MKKMIDELKPGLPELTIVVAEFLTLVREQISQKQKKNNHNSPWVDDATHRDPKKQYVLQSETKNKLNIKKLDILKLYHLWTNNRELIQTHTTFSHLAYEYLSEARRLRNESHHFYSEHDHLIKDDYKNRGLDTIRRLMSMLIPYINNTREPNDFIEMPEFEYSIIQPDDSRVIGEYIPQTMKAKVVEDISLKKAYFDFGKARLKVTKNNLKHIFKDFNYLRDKESILVVRTYGDLFRYESDRTGYTGDWRVNEEVSKICVFHFYGGEQSESAHVYVADYVRKSEETNYREDSPRYRYYFKNIEYAGEINSVRTSEFDSWQIINMDD